MSQNGRHASKPPDRESKSNCFDLFAAGRSFSRGVENFMGFWNEKMYLPKIRGTPRQCREIGIRLKDQFFIDNYEEAILLIAKSKFLRGSKGFRISIDWFLVSDNFDKVLEGKYTDLGQTQITEERTHTFVDEFGEEQIR